MFHTSSCDYQELPVLELPRAGTPSATTASAGTGIRCTALCGGGRRRGAGGGGGASGLVDLLALADAVVEDVLKYMKPDAEITVGFYKEEAVSVDVGNFVELEVTEAPPGFKGDTATGATKIVTFETGLETQVPLFVKEGDVIRIDTRSNSYVTRV